MSELGLEDEVIPVTSKHPSATKRYIYAKGKIHLLPNKMVSLFTTQPPLSRSVMSSIINEPFKSKSNDLDETIYDFINRRVGKEVSLCPFKANLYSVEYSEQVEILFMRIIIIIRIFQQDKSFNKCIAGFNACPA